MRKLVGGAGELVACVENIQKGSAQRIGCERVSPISNSKYIKALWTSIPKKHPCGTIKSNLLL